MMRRWLFPAAIAVASAAALPVSAAEVRACGTSLAVTADAPSFASAERDATPARLERLAAEVASVFQAEAAQLCEETFLGAQDFVGLEGLLVQNGEGAAEPTFYRTKAHPGMLVFQYAFTGGGAPDSEAVERGLRCWRRPDLDSCYQD